MADTHGYPYRALGSLADAQQHEHGVIVLEGDNGARIYAVLRARRVQCTEARLLTLLRDLDAIA